MVSRLTKRGQVTIPKLLRDNLELEPGQELEFEQREGALIIRRRAPTARPGHPTAPLRNLVGLIRERVDVDAYLSETRGPRTGSRSTGRG